MRHPPALLVRAALAGGSLVLSSCGPKAPPGPPTPAAGVGPALVVYDADAAGVHRLDGRAGRDSVAVLGARLLTSAVSPDRGKLAVAYAAEDGARLALIDVASGRVSALHSAGQGYTYTLAWSPDGRRLAFGYFTARRSGRDRVPDRGDVAIATAEGKLTRVGCEASKIVFAWTSRDTIVVGDGRDLFPVSVRGCRGRGVIYGAGKDGVTFSPDGKRLFYYRTGRVRRGRRTVSASELDVANSDGTADHRIIGAAYDPQHARWSPDGSRLAFDVQSPDSGAARYIAVFDLEPQRMRFFPSKTAQGVPSDTDPAWAPNGTQIVHRRSLGGEHDWILRTLSQDPAAVHVEPTVLLSGTPLGTVWGWVDDTRAVVVSDQWMKIVTTDGTVIYTLAGAREVLAVSAVR